MPRRRCTILVPRVPANTFNTSYHFDYICENTIHPAVMSTYQKDQEQTAGYRAKIDSTLIPLHVSLLIAPKHCTAKLPSIRTTHLSNPQRRHYSGISRVVK
jgi:hypothetical protein